MKNLILSILMLVGFFGSAQTFDFTCSEDDSSSIFINSVEIMAENGISVFDESDSTWNIYTTSSLASLSFKSNVPDDAIERFLNSANVEQTDDFRFFWNGDNGLGDDYMDLDDYDDILLSGENGVVIDGGVSFADLSRVESVYGPSLLNGGFLYVSRQSTTDASDRETIVSDFFLFNVFMETSFDEAFEKALAKAGNGRNIYINGTSYAVWVEGQEYVIRSIDGVTLNVEVDADGNITNIIATYMGLESEFDSFGDALDFANNGPGHSVVSSPDADVEFDDTPSRVGIVDVDGTYTINNATADADGYYYAYFTPIDPVSVLSAFNADTGRTVDVTISAIGALDGNSFTGRDTVTLKYNYFGALIHTPIVTVTWTVRDRDGNPVHHVQEHFALDFNN